MAGSVYKVGDRWYVHITLPRDPQTGKRSQIKRAVKGNKREAEKLLTELQGQVQSGAPTKAVKSTLGEFLEMWLKERLNQIGIKTGAEYAAIVRRLPASLTTVRLDKLTTLDLQRYYREAQENGGKNSQGLSARTLLHHHRLLAHALSTAVAWQLLQRNPADHVEAPRPKRAEQKSLSVEQVATVLKAAEGTYYYLPVLLALATGCRRGEVVALQWCDFDFDARKVTIQRSVEVTAGRLAFKGTKTEQIHTVTLPPDVIDTLVEYRRQQTHDLGAQELVFPSETGGIYHPDRITHGFERILEKCNFTVRFHDLRHSHASLLFAAGIPLKTISERLGHASIGITADTYTHLSGGAQDAAAAAIGAILQRGQSTQSQA